MILVVKSEYEKDTDLMIKCLGELKLENGKLQRCNEEKETMNRPPSIKPAVWILLGIVVMGVFIGGVGIGYRFGK